MTSETRVLFIWDVPDRLKDYLVAGLTDVEGLELVFPEEANEETYLKEAPGSDIVVGWRPTPELLECAEDLKLLINPGAGIQHHIRDYRETYQERGIVFVNGHGNSYFTAQHAVALLLALTNKLIPHHNWMKAGYWRRGDSHAKSIPLRRRHIGLLGYGAVNKKVHRFLAGFDLEFSVLRHSWKGKNEDLPTEVSKYRTGELEQFLKAIDILIIAVPHTQETAGMIGMYELELLGEEGFLVNVARGVVVDEDSLYNALIEQKIAGAAIDVWYEYRPEPDEDGEKHPSSFAFHKLDNVVLSPHRGASPFDDLERWDEVIENITRFAQGRTDFLNRVDLEREY